MAILSHLALEHVSFIWPSCLEQELVSVITDKARQVRELDFLCSAFSDEEEGSLLGSQAL